MKSEKSGKNMTIEQIVEKLEIEIKGEGKKEVIESYETELSKNVDDLSKNENFFNLPLKGYHAAF